MRTLLCLTAITTLLLAGLLPTPAAAQSESGLYLDEPTKEVRAIEFTALTPEGGKVNLSSYKGKVVVLNFWATWCIPCRVEMPAMQSLHQRMADKPFAMLAVSQGDTAEQVRGFARKYKLTFPMLLDEDGTIGITYRADQLPITYLIDTEGFIVGRAIGPREWDSAEAVRYIESLMAGHSKGSAVRSSAVQSSTPEVGTVYPGALQVNTVSDTMSETMSDTMSETVSDTMSETVSGGGRS